MGTILTLRITPAQRDKWQREAEREGLMLSDWVRRRCDGEGIQVRSGAVEKKPVEGREGEMFEEVAEPRKGKKRGAVVSSKVERAEVSCPHGLKVGYRCSLCKPGGGIVQADGSVK